MNYVKPLKPVISYLADEINQLKTFFNTWYGKNNKNAYFGSYDIDYLTMKNLFLFVTVSFYFFNLSRSRFLSISL